VRNLLLLFGFNLAGSRSGLSTGLRSRHQVRICQPGGLRPLHHHPVLPDPDLPRPGLLETNHGGGGRSDKLQPSGSEVVKGRPDDDIARLLG